MQEDARPTVEVTIAPALRAMVAERKAAGRGGSAPQPVRRPLVQPQMKGAIDSDGRWALVSLRRDGKRPLRFQGVQIAKHEEKVVLQEQTYTHCTAIYVDQLEHVYLSLALRTPPNALLRSFFDAFVLQPGQAAQTMTNWFAKITASARLLTPSSYPSPNQDAVQHALRSISSLGLKSEQMPRERKRT